MLPDDRSRIKHMLEAALLVRKFLEKRTRSDLDHDLQLQFAVVRALEIVGEAASKVSVQTRTSLPDVPWTKAIAIRNRLIHAYFNIDRDILWNTATVSVPELLVRLEEAGFA
jgi:uncharacterized protein with HEPN domain